MYTALYYKVQSTPLSTSSTQQVWELVAGNRTSVLPWVDVRVCHLLLLLFYSFIHLGRNENSKRAKFFPFQRHEGVKLLLTFCSVRCQAQQVSHLWPCQFHGFFLPFLVRIPNFCSSLLGEVQDSDKVQKISK